MLSMDYKYVMSKQKANRPGNCMFLLEALRATHVSFLTISHTNPSGAHDHTSLHMCIAQPIIGI